MKARGVSQGVMLLIPLLTLRASKNHMSTSAASNVSSAQSDALSQQIGIALLKKQQDAVKAQGAAVVQLLQTAANLSKAAGKGDGFDAMG